MNLLVINAGSSSLKYQLFAMPSDVPLYRGQIERITDHAAAFAQMLARLTDAETGVIDSPDAIAAVGHRVVHGGERFASATLITQPVKEAIRALFALAPLHNPINYACIELAEQTFPNARQVAIFDTAFHQTLPAHAYRYALPAALYEQEGIRVYGFHGTSHQYVSRQAGQWLGKPDAKLISLHLGNGSSITAVRAGHSVDTSMGFGPLSGLVMGTRSGDLDPSVIFHLIDRGYSPEAVSQLLNKQSGMLGLAGVSDMRDLRRAIEAGDERAALAGEVYAYRARKYIGAYAAALNGLDAILFTGGIGENDVAMRAQICQGLDFLGIRLDAAANNVPSRDLRAINAPDSPVQILVVPTNEELEIARQSYGLLGEDTSLEAD